MYVDGAFLRVKRSCITPWKKDVGGGERIEIFASVKNSEFDELLEKGWEYD